MSLKTQLAAVTAQLAAATAQPAETTAPEPAPTFRDLMRAQQYERAARATLPLLMLAPTDQNVER